MPPEEAERPYSSEEMATAEKFRRKAIVGSVEQVAARLKELAKSLDLDELVVVTWTYDPAPRHRSYELLADAFELEKTSALFASSDPSSELEAFRLISRPTDDRSA